MFTKELNEFKEKYKIPSPDKWAELSGVSKSTIVRALRGDNKDMGLHTFLQLIEPYASSVDEVLGLGSFSPEAIAEEKAKSEMVEKIENVIDAIDNSDEIPQEPAQEIKEVLAEAQEIIAKEPEVTRCAICDVLRETIDELKTDKATKDKWILRLFSVSVILTALVAVLSVNVLM